MKHWLTRPDSPAPLLAAATGLAIVAGLAIIGWFKPEPWDPERGCREDEAAVTFQARTTCHAWDDLPVELRYYLAPPHMRNADGTPK